MRRRTRLSQLPLNALRAFEATARTLSFTRAGLELRVTQAAVSQQVKILEDRLGAQLFRRLPRGVALTDEGQLLLPSIVDAFRRLTETLNRFEDNRYQDVISVGVVGTFASGWLLPRLGAFRKAHPTIDLRLFTNNNRVDIAGEGLDYAIRFGDGLWHGTEATHLRRRLVHFALRHWRASWADLPISNARCCYVPTGMMNGHAGLPRRD